MGGLSFLSLDGELSAVLAQRLVCTSCSALGGTGATALAGTGAIAGVTCADYLGTKRGRNVGETRNVDRH